MLQCKERNNIATWPSDYCPVIFFLGSGIMFLLCHDVGLCIVKTAMLISAVYIIVILIAVAIKVEGKDGTSKGHLDCIIPMKVWGLFIFLGLVLVMICGFAHLYLHSSAIFDSKDKVLADFHSAKYFSMVTITTLGFGDYSPKDPAGKTLVMLEIGAAILLFFAAFPLLISRISNWRSS